MEEVRRWRKSEISSVDILDYPVRNGKILPKFHFILPNFYFVPRWWIFVCSLEISDFLGRDRLERLLHLVGLVGLVSNFWVLTSTLAPLNPK
jgi:hypothetical protein